MDLTTRLMLSAILSPMGFAYFMYGKKRGNAVSMISGALLFFGTYLAPNIYVLLCAAFVLIAAPFVIRLG
ncbi:hypothetical protein ACFL1X_08060 [Candidatus Hydrogenedentota bacterium]